MNGIFTESESKHLSPKERIHYSSIGLCSPGMNSDLDTLEYELTCLADEHAECVANLNTLERKIFTCRVLIRESKSICEELKAKVLELLT